jgi:hypothetical protein
MNNEPEKNNLRDRVLGAIKTGQTTMKPRWRFVTETALYALGSVLLLLTIIYIISFIIFVLHQTGVWFVPTFGFRGIWIFLFSLPWILICISILFIILLEILVRHYAFGYRRPFLYSALGIIGLVIVGGVVIAATPLHPQFLRGAREGRLPFGSGLYQQFGMQHFHDVHPGTVTELIEDGFSMKSPNDVVYTVLITPETRLPFGTNFVVSDRVLVIGEESSTTIEAEGILKTESGTTSQPRATVRRIHFYPRSN